MIDNPMEVFKTYPVGLPVYTWSASLLVVCDRKVRLLEETVVRLINEGVSDIEDIKNLLGLDDPAIINRTVQFLIECGVLSYNVIQSIHVTEKVGREFLASALIKDERKLEKIHIEYDPMRKQFSWRQAATLALSAVKADGAHPIRPPTPLSVNFLPQHFQDVQQLVKKKPGPLRAHPLGKDVEKFELQDLLPVKPQLRYVRGALEVSQHANGDWTYRVLKKGSEDPAATETIRTWEVEGHAVLPVQDNPLIQPNHLVRAFLQAIAPLNRSDAYVTDLDKQRMQLREAIQNASTSLFISPATGMLNYTEDLPGWIEAAINASKELRVVLGVDEGGLSRKIPAGFLKQQMAVLRGLKQKYPEQVVLREMHAPPCRAVIINNARIHLQVLETRQHTPGKYFVREVMLPAFDASSEIGQSIGQSISQLLLPSLP